MSEKVVFEPGLESFFKEFNHQKRLAVAAVTNFTGRDRNGVHVVTRLANDGRFILKRIFTPEHGFNSDAPDGEHVESTKDASLGIDIISLYGKQKKPALEQLKDIDLLIYDMQDVGVRFYTYISTLRNILDAADEAGIPVAVLDRPDILGGITVEGPMLEQELTSFVGHLPVALRYGMTPGELALWWKQLNNLKIDVQVFKCQNYQCPDTFSKLGFPWYKMSPSMPDMLTAAFYPGTCLFEGTNISEGRGTDAPFRNLGAPWINSALWLEALRPILPDTISAEKSSFIPTFSKHENEECHGIKLISRNEIVADAVYIGIAALYSLMASHPGKIEFTGRPGLKNPFIDYLAGTENIRTGLVNGDKPDSILKSCSMGVKEFARTREKHFLYQRRN